MRKWVGIVLTAPVLLGLAVLAAWASAPDPSFNPASFEQRPLAQRLLPIEEAATLAQFIGPDGTHSTMIVLAADESSVTGVDLTRLGAQTGEDPFAALAQANITPLRQGEQGDWPQLTVPIADLLPSAPAGGRHIGTGTNFPEHAEEASSTAVFQFPKFGIATPARTQVRAESGILLDYEVELCMRFDREIANLADFDAATKGIFLCGDFTNRNALVHLADPDDLDSGSGFSDAKSGPDFFPTGPFLVVPRDWQAVARDLRMTTSLNGEPRQDARGGEMTLDFRALAEKALADMARPRFLYRGDMHLLAPHGRIERDMTLMSGTAEGTIFTPPSRADIIEAGLVYARNLGPFGERDFMDTARNRFIANELAGAHFLQPGDIVRHGSNYLGDIEVLVTQ